VPDLLAHVREMVAADLMRDDSVNNQMPMVTEVGVLDDKITATCLAVGLLHRRNIVAHGGQARVMADLLQRSQDRLVGVLHAASVLLAGVDVIAELVDDAPIARADKRRRLTVAWLAWPAAVLTTCKLPQQRNKHTKVLTEPRCPCRLALCH